jgi:hypothetical protein
LFLICCRVKIGLLVKSCFPPHPAGGEAGQGGGYFELFYGYFSSDMRFTIAKKTLHVKQQNILEEETGVLGGRISLRGFDFSVGIVLLSEPQL